ncbi:MAG TPA: enoyl-CoA hydratase-related protein [Gemmatimonadaceae bacterium]|nr:enoyl-CoA hydratase-related protein [Gemmatimonadaceae bacterium]
MNDSFLLDHRDGVLTVTFNRPERLNAFRRAEYHRLRDLLGEIERDAAVRVVVLTGSGRGFCAGEDLKELDAASHEAAGHDAALTRENALVLQDITRTVVRSERVYLAAVNGVAAGFGAELACACDVRLAGEGGRFLFPEVKRGLFITNGISYTLPRLVGDNWAATLLLTGDGIDAPTAKRIGLVSEVVAGESLLAVAQAMAAGIAANAPTAVRHTKRILRGDADALERALATEVAYLDAVLASGEYLEGARAFVEKRLPRYGR